MSKVGNKIFTICLETERTLSKVAMVPMVGTVAGLAKVLMGVAQSIVGLAGRIFTPKSELNAYFMAHAKHGLGNIVAGAVEAIPLVGLFLYIYRCGKGEEENSTIDIKQHEAWQLDKFMPYDYLSAYHRIAT